MLARVLSAAVNGIEAFPVEVELNCGWGDTVVVIVAVPDDLAARWPPWKRKKPPINVGFGASAAL
ncbi:MAG: hypothetical protein ABSF38_21660 [Verrucomicrobiota bacterium]|jgi:hypothetical protein